MHHLYRIFFCAVLLHYMAGLYGQEVHGTVSNTGGHGIEFANIMLLAEDGNDMIGYTITDENGSYTLEVEQWQGMLVASSLGYQADTILLHAPLQGNRLQIDIQLTESTFNLQSVEVSDARIPYKLQGDTVTYQSEFFMDGTEQLIEDLVRKLPGASVADDGTIFYKGKQVDKVLLEEDELFGSRYTVATRSLSAEVVDEIQFIDHYMDNALLKGVSQSDQLAMNITIKEDRKKLLFGNTDLGVGYPGRYEGSLNAYSLYKEHKAILIGNAENTASATLDMYSLLGEGVRFDDPYEYSRAARYFVHLPAYIPFELERPQIKNGHNLQGAANLVLHPNEKLRIRSYGLGFKDNEMLNSSSFFRDLNLGNLYEYEDYSLYDETSNGFEWNTEAHWQIGGQSNMKYSFSINRSRLSGRANTRVNRPEQDTIFQDLENGSRVYAHRLNWVRKLDDKRVLVIDAAYFADGRTQHFNFDFRPNSLPKAQRTEQANIHQVRDVDLLASLLGKKGTLKYAFGLKYRHQTDAWEVGISSGDFLEEPLLPEEPLLSDYYQRFLALIGSFSAQIGIARLFSKIEVGYRQASLEQTLEPKKMHEDLYPSFRAGLDLSLSRKSSIMISGAVNTQFPELQEVVSGPFLNSYRSISSGIDRIDPYYSYTAMLAFKHSNNARLLEFSVNSIFIGNARAYTDQYFYEGVFVIREKQIVNGGYHWSTNVDFDKYFPALSANVGLNLTGTSRLSYLLASDATPNQVRMQTKALELSYTTLFDGPLNVGIIGNTTWSNYQQTGANAPLRTRNHRWGMEYFLTLKPVKQLFIKLKTRQIFTLNQGREAKTIYLGGVRSEYQLSSGIRLGCTIHNLWNTRRFNLEQLGGESYGFQEWQLNPRMILANVGFRF